MKPLRLRNDAALLLRFAALGAVAFVFACVAHEAIGHGGTCVLTGGRVQLLTSVFFHCSPGSNLVDAAGPLMNLALAAVALIILRTPPRSANTRAFVALLLAFNAMWGGGYLVYSAITARGDWAFFIGSDGLFPAWTWRVLMALAGLWLYAWTMRLIAPHLPRGIPLVVAYVAALAVILLSVLLNSGPALPAAREALLEGGLAPVGLLYIASLRATGASSSSALPADIPGPGFWVCALGVVIVFLVFMGPGYRAA